uniref:cellulase n=1 Tax=Peruphasma schultei TaxID=614134 RepID=A0A125SKZ5_9NEOP|nr:glycoside hydrolase family 9 [Peruphasma schultei]
MKPISIGAVVLVSVISIAVAGSYDYKDVLQKSLLFYEAQRSGKLPADQKVKWRKDSALKDKGQNGEDLTGGYFDAGDFVKFGFPMAFTTTILSWGLLDHHKGYESANSVSDCLKAIKWATDYFIKCHVSEYEYYGQVGSGTVDHAHWSRPEDMTEERPAYKITASQPAADLAGETAAAFAAASLVFRSTNSSYANTLLNHAKQMYDFAYKHRGLLTDAIPDSKCCYVSTHYEDELVWGAAWLYRATNDKTYLTYVDALWDSFKNMYGFDWDQKYAGAVVLLAKLTGDSKYKTAITNNCNYVFQQAARSNKGLLYLANWGPLRYAVNYAFVCLQAADLGINTQSYRTEAKKQLDYALGDAGRSYVIGFGNNPPTHAHHRAASCPDAPAVCNWDTYHGSQPNAHVLYGGMVGGPAKDDSFKDDRTDYQHTEVGCDYNACFQSMLAHFIELGN